MTSRTGAVSRRKNLRTQGGPGRWTEAGGRIFSGRMIALKNDPVWLRISDFGHPHPPFAFGSGMDMVDISRIDAVRLELTGWRYEIEVAPCPICDDVSNSDTGNNDEVTTTT